MTEDSRHLRAIDCVLISCIALMLAVLIGTIGGHIQERMQAEQVEFENRKGY